MHILHESMYLKYASTYLYGLRKHYFKPTASYRISSSRVLNIYRDVIVEPKEKKNRQKVTFIIVEPLVTLLNKNKKKT